MKRIAPVILTLLFVSLPLMAMKGAVYSTRGPVRNARIELFAAGDHDAAIDQALAGKTPAPDASGTTNDGGFFSIEAKSAGAVWIVVSAPGFAPDRSLVSADASDITVALVEAETKSGTVRSAAGAVRGAKVFAVDTLNDVIAVYETDEHGRFSMPDPTHWAGVCVEHSDFATVCRQPRGERAGSPISLDFTLVPGTVVSGRVVNTAGKPVANARVMADDFTRATTREDGSFRLRIGPDDKQLRATADGLTGTAKASAGVTIAIAPGRTISGSVRDEAGHALAGARVIVQSDNADFDRAIATVNRKGEYAITTLDASQYGVYVQAPQEFEFEPKPADLRKKTAVRVDLSAKTSALVRGIVRDEQKQPVAGATVMQMIEGLPLVYGTRVGYVSTVTGPDGTFRIRTAQRATRLAAMKAGFAAGVTEKLDERTAAKPVTITLPAGVAVSGTVVDNKEKPVADAQIVVMVASTTLGAVPIASSLAAGALGEWTRSDEQGRFSVHLNRGVHDFAVWRKGYAGNEVSNVEVSDATAPLRVVLDPAVEIRGRVAFKGAKRDDETVIYAIETTQRRFAQATVAEDGSFVIDSLEPGTYMLRLANGARGAATKVVTAPAHDVVLEVADTIEIHGSVTDKATGAPIPGYEVSVTSGDFYDSNEVEAPNGQFSQSVPVGAVEVAVAAPGYIRATRTITVAASKEPDPLTFALTKGRKITGRITSAEGRPIAEAAVGIEDSYSDGAASDEDGEYEYPGAPTGEITLSVSKDGFLPVRKVVAAGSGDERVDISMNSGLKISGRVTDKTGTPVEDAHVSASSEAHDAPYQNATTDKSGAFTLEGLAAAHYTLTAAKSPLGQAKQTDVDVTKPQTIVLVLGSEPTGTIHGSIAGAAGGGWMMAMVSATNEHGSSSAQVGRDGKFVVENVPVGEVSVRGMMMSMSRQSSTKAVKVNVPAGGDVEVQLSAAGDTTIRGVVRSGGQPMPGATVAFWSSDGEGQWRSQTAADGAYEVSGLEKGRYSVSVSRSEGGEYATELEVTGPAAFDIDVDFAQIAGHVIDDRGVPIEGASVKAAAGANHNAREVTATSDATGSFSMTVQSGAAYRISGAKRGFATGFVDVTGTSAPVVLQLHRGDGARVRLIDVRNGSTLSGYVVVRDESGKAQIPVSGDQQPDGSLLLPLAEGTYRVSASANEYASNTIALAVPSAETTIPLTRGGTLIVRSTDDATELIRLVMPNGDEYVRCYCNGIAEIRLTGAVTRVDHVAPGAYRMDVVDAHGVTRHSYPVTIAEGQETTVDATK